MDQLWQLIGLALTSGAIASLLTYFINKKKENRSDFDTIIKTWSEDNTRLRTLEEASRLRISHLEIEVFELRNKIIMLESAHQDLPIPMWLKDEKGQILAVNPSYELEFLNPNDLTIGDIIGKTAYEFLPKDIADEHTLNDKKVFLTGKTYHGKERMQIGDTILEIPVTRYLRKAGNMKLGIAGIAYTKYI